MVLVRAYKLSSGLKSLNLFIKNCNLQSSLKTQLSRDYCNSRVIPDMSKLRNIVFTLLSLDVHNQWLPNLGQNHA